MRRLCGWLLPLALLAAGPYRSAQPGYQYEFPRDHFAHGDFQTEWWYWTGNLSAAGGRQFGFELTFFRHNVNPARPASPWDVSDVYLAHLALTDVRGQRFYHTERVNRAGPGLAGIDAGRGLIWNGNWSAHIGAHTGSALVLKALTAELAFDLKLTPRKPPVVQGREGVSQKAQGEGKASHYVSFTRLGAEGTLRFRGEQWAVTGLAWMDHEFFTNQLGSDQAGWDWFCVQLDNNEELMFYRIRRRDGSGDTYSSATFIDAAGKAHPLRPAEFQLAAEPGCWLSPESKACYPLRWNLRVPSLRLHLSAQPLLENQELYGTKSVSPIYWEGAMSYAGTRAGVAVRGGGYLELTGYHSPFTFGTAGGR